MTAVALQLTGASVAYGAHVVLTGLDMTVARGELVVCIGPSGCGKTTLLHLLAGHQAPLSGTVERLGESRMIYQAGGLFPWLTARENIAMGLRHVAEPGARASKLGELVALVSLQGFEEHYPHQLSGGMKQRVELARAMAAEADVLLLDEPFSSLDYQTRVRMRRELLATLAIRPRTVVLVTHDIEEAVQLADRVIVLAGRPATVRRELRLDTPRPRDPTDPAVVAAMRLLLDELGLS